MQRVYFQCKHHPTESPVLLEKLHRKYPLTKDVAGRKQKWGSKRGTWLDFSLFDKQRYFEASWKENIKSHSGCCCCFSASHFGNKCLTVFCFKWFQCLCLDPCWDPGKEEFSSRFLKWSWKPSHWSQQRASWIKYCQRAEETEQEMGQVYQEDTLCELQVTITLCHAAFKVIFSRLTSLLIRDWSIFQSTQGCQF